MKCRQVGLNSSVALETPCLAGLLALVFAVASPAQSKEAERAADYAKVYAGAVREINERHACSPGRLTEADLAKKLPAAATRALDALLAMKPSEGLSSALRAASDAALDLDRTEDFARIRAKRAQTAPENAGTLDTMLSRPRFVLCGANGVDEGFLARFGEVLDGVLAAYDEVFGFGEWSKVPGKKLRVRVHLVDRIVAPPHFAPEFSFHSEIDFPVDDKTSFRSPTADGKFLFYGLCHELGHVVAMWGDPRREADHHAWAHYTGVAVVEHLSSAENPPTWMNDLRDVKWRSLALEREAAKGRTPSLDTREGVMALFLRLHDALGPRAIGAALNSLDREDKRLRVNRVRYYEFADLKRALLRGEKEKVRRDAVAELFP